MKGIGENLGRGDGMISLPPIVMAYLNMFFDINRTALLLLYIEDFNPGLGWGRYPQQGLEHCFPILIFSCIASCKGIQGSPGL